MKAKQKAVEELQPIYTTPKKVVDFVQLHLLIINPPYDNRSNSKEDSL
jgi:hypothetical protein